MKNSRILVVDENVEVAQLEQAMFGLHSQNVEVTVHAEEALRRLTTRKYDVLVVGAPIEVRDRYLLDILMTDHSPLLPSTIVVTWRRDDKTIIERCTRAGVYAVLGKPFDVEELSRVVAECIANDSHPIPTRWIGISQALIPKSDSAG